MTLADDGDVRAVRELPRAFDSVELDRDERGLTSPSFQLTEMGAAIEALGGTLSDRQQRKLARARRSRHWTDEPA